MIDIVSVGDDVVITHLGSRLTVGAAHPAGPHSVDTLILAVLTHAAN